MIQDTAEFRIIDTIGLGDKKIDKNEIVQDISNALQTLKDGINVVLFVFKKGRLDKFGLATFDYVSEVILGPDGKKNSLLVVTGCQDSKWIPTNAQQDKDFKTIVDYCQLGSVAVDFLPKTENQKLEEAYCEVREASFSSLLKKLAEVPLTQPFIPELSKLSEEDRVQKIVDSLTVRQHIAHIYGKISKDCVLL